MHMMGCSCCTISGTVKKKERCDGAERKLDRGGSSEDRDLTGHMHHWSQALSFSTFGFPLAAAAPLINHIIKAVVWAKAQVVRRPDGDEAGRMEEKKDEQLTSHRCPLLPAGSQAKRGKEEKKGKKGQTQSATGWLQRGRRTLEKTRLLICLESSDVSRDSASQTAFAETWPMLKRSHLSDANEQTGMTRRLHRIQQRLILFWHPTTSALADSSFRSISKTFLLSRLERAPAASYPGCEGKNCSAAPSLPPAQMHLGKGWTVHHHLKQEPEEAWFLENKHVDARAPIFVQLCVCVHVCVWNLYPLCQSSGWQPRGAQGGRSRSAARRWKERTELCRSPWNPSDQIWENIIVSEMLKENRFLTRQVWL